MKVAVPLFGSRVSPRFGCAGEIMVAEIADGVVTATQMVPCSAMSPHQIAGHLAELGVSTLICGGINYQHEAMLLDRGITLIRGVGGEADAAVCAFAANSLAPGAAFPRSCGRRRRGRCSAPWRQDAT